MKLKAINKQNLKHYALLRNHFWAINHKFLITWPKINQQCLRNHLDKLIATAVNDCFQGRFILSALDIGRMKRGPSRYQDHFYRSDQFLLDINNSCILNCRGTIIILREITELVKIVAEMESTKFLDFLDSYRGRDKVLRTLCYTTKCVSGLVKSPELSTRLDSFSGQMSACRAALRLLDDLPMLAYVLEYGCGRNERDQYLRMTNVICNVVDLVFYPIDHISWAIDYNIISCKDTRWGTANTALWAISLFLTIAKSMRGLYLLTEEKLSMTGENVDRAEIERINKKQKALWIAALRAMADITYAVHYLPRGVLWAGALKKWHIGALGSLSSFLGLYTSFS